MGTQVILGATEKLHFQSWAKTRKADETFFSVNLFSLTNLRIYSEDAEGTLLWNHYLKDIDRAEKVQSFWKGTQIKVCLKTGNEQIFSVMRTQSQEDEHATLHLVNTINQMLLVMRNV